MATTDGGINWADEVENQIQGVSNDVSQMKVAEKPLTKEEEIGGDKATSKAEASLLTKILRTKLIENTNDVVVQQNDPTSPLYSVKSFEELRL